MELDTGASRSRSKTIGFGVAAAGVALALLDLIVLRGEQVDSATVRLASDEPATIEIARVGEAHLVEISTRRIRRGETAGRSVEYRLEAPDGRVVFESSELVVRKRRFERFEPEQAGEYRLYVDDPGLLGGRSGSARVSVYVNDRRIRAHLLPF